MTDNPLGQIALRQLRTLLYPDGIPSGADSWFRHLFIRFDAAIEEAARLEAAENEPTHSQFWPDPHKFQQSPSGSAACGICGFHVTNQIHEIGASPEASGSGGGGQRAVAAQDKSDGLPNVVSIASAECEPSPPAPHAERAEDELADVDLDAPVFPESGESSPTMREVLQFADDTRDGFNAMVKGLADRPAPTPAQPQDGVWVYVPVDPTVEMVEAGRAALSQGDPKMQTHARVMWVWADMLKAAPKIKRAGAGLAAEWRDRPVIYGNAEAASAAATWSKIGDRMASRIEQFEQENAAAQGRKIG